MSSGIYVLDGGLVLTLEPGEGVIFPGTLVVSNGVIQYVGSACEAPPVPGNADVIDCTGRIVMPGLINAHTHLPMSLFRGLADDLPLQSWLDEHMFPAESASIDEESAAVGTELSVAEMLLGGTTCCADGYFHEASVVRAALAMGIRGVYAQGCIDFPAPGAPDPSGNLAALARFLNDFPRESLARPGIFTHSPYTCGSATLRGAWQVAREHGVLFFIHAAETAGEVTWCRDKCGGLTPIRYLDSLGILDPETVLIHAVHLTEDDADCIAEHDCGVVLNPESNLKLASGIPPAELLRQRGIRLALGTDGCASNNDLDMFGELRTASALWGAEVNEPGIPPRELLGWATAGGADVLRLPALAGPLRPGRQADLAVLGIRPEFHACGQDPFAYVVRCARPGDVEWVFVDGVPQVKEGRLLDGDPAAIMNRANTLSQDIRRFAVTP